MKTHHRAIAVSALLFAVGCASVPAKPPYAAFESIAVPKGLEYRPGESTVIETPEVKAGRVVYRGRLEPETLAAAMRSSLEADGWRLVASTSSRSGATQMYDKAGTQLQVRIWEGGPLSWYTYVELAAAEMAAGRPHPGSVPVPSSTPTPSEAPKPSASVIPDAPAPVITR
jgi:hypothetical protein